MLSILGVFQNEILTALLILQVNFSSKSMSHHFFGKNLSYIRLYLPEINQKLVLELLFCEFLGLY